MKKVFVLLLLLIVSKIYAQQEYTAPYNYSVDSLKKRLHYAKTDTNKVKLLDSIGGYFAYTRTDSAPVYLRQALSLSQELKFKTGEISTLQILGEAHEMRGDYSESLSAHLKALRVAENVGDKNLIYESLEQIGVLNEISENHQKASDYLSLVQNHLAELKWPDLSVEASYTWTATAFFKMNKIDSAQYFMQKAYLLDLKTKSHWYPLYRLMADLQEKKGDYQKAINYIRPFIHGPGPDIEKFFSCGDLALRYHKIGKGDSAIYFARKAIKNREKLGMLIPVLQAAQTLTEEYASRHQPDSAYKYQTMMLAIQDSMFGQEKAHAIEAMTIGEQVRREELIAAKQKYNNSIRIYLLAGALVVFLIVGFILWRNNKKQKHTNQLLNEQKEEISAQRDNLERQNHELEIEAALERVRARTMAMQRSDELAETAYVLYQQFTSLGETPIQITIGIINSEDNTIEFWGTDLTGNKNDKTAKGSLDEPFLLNKLFAAWKKKEKSAMIALSGRELKGWIEYRQQISGLTSPDDDMQGTRYVYLGYFSKGAISISTEDPLPRETIIILERFAAVFDGTYTRFLDLKKAEAQAREAQIEAALERVRSKTMAMYNSQDVAGTSVTMFQELVKLGVESTARCGVSIISNTNDLEVWTASLKDDGSVTLNIGRVSITAHPLLLNVFTSWKDGESSTTYEMTGDAVRSYFQALNDAPGYPFQYPLDSLPEKWGINAFFFPEGCLFAFTSEPLSAEMSQVFKRFAGVFGQTYRRFLDLQKAESQAREAIKQASVDRVRGEIASMRTTLDLERIIPLVWNELTILGIPFIRCGVFIVNEEAELIHTHLSTPDGKALAAFDMAFDAQDINREALHAWRKKQIATIHWSAEVFAAYTKDLISQGAVISDGKYVVERPDTPLDLHFFPFLQGMLYVGNTAPLSDDEKDLVQSLAYAFSTAYARYEDFNKLEAAKQQVDKTLVELKAAQKQLVQSEKMASLGELTAGIAHEIQNPLNFVNNFSEVSAELIEEMTEELDKGDIEEVKVIAGDIRDNLEKIRHHGKRADGIVKGMLQHSRASSGQKEPADLNVLADEYLRLSYHGLRAKDKSFNAELVTHFDKKLPKVSVVPQDMGRVILNIINNAFYATQQRQKTAGSDYKPTVEVKTQASDGHALISVKDNGVGIPESIRDKIMQPFFTTKPTGEGTGLGLSLSYDIVVKSHGGNINVNTKENEYTEFIVILPIS